MNEDMPTGGSPGVRILRTLPAAHRRPWTPDEDQRLRRMIAEGALIGDIAGALGRTREGVRNHANALNLPVRSSPGAGRRRLEPMPRG